MRKPTTSLRSFLLAIVILSFLGITTGLYQLFIGNQYPRSKIIGMYFHNTWSMSSCKNKVLSYYIPADFQSRDTSAQIGDWYRQRYNDFPQNITFLNFHNMHVYLSQQLLLPPPEMEQNEETLHTSFIIITVFQICIEG